MREAKGKVDDVQAAAAEVFDSFGRGSVSDTTRSGSRSRFLVGPFVDVETLERTGREATVAVVEGLATAEEEVKVDEFVPAESFFESD
jgi:hypothetical protein